MPTTISKTIYRYILETNDFESCVGFVYAFNYNDAMAQITEHYRDLKIRSITIEVWVLDIVEIYRS